MLVEQIIVHTKELHVHGKLIPLHNEFSDFLSLCVSRLSNGAPTAYPNRGQMLKKTQQRRHSRLAFRTFVVEGTGTKLYGNHQTRSLA